MNYNDIFSPFTNVEDAIQYYSEKVKSDFDFLKQEQIGINEVDIKRSEARICIVMGCSISAIVMVGVILEEFLKSLLKYKVTRENRNKEIEPNLSEMSRLSTGAEKEFGFFRLHNAIEKARKENIITEEEKNELMQIKDNIRNAFIHSEKSKIFDSENKTNVFQVGFKDNNIQVEDKKLMSILDLLPVQGIAQKKFANENAKNIFNDVDSMILEISKRFFSGE